MALINFFIGGILLIIGLVNLAGGGKSMIAGYNTKSPEEQAKINIKALSRFMGAMLILAAVILIVGGFFNTTALWISYLLFFVIIVFMVIFMNTGNRFKNK